ncbi:MAG: hypothetical protein R6X02_34935, partial [Enhygromyxa sp.]
GDGDTGDGDGDTGDGDGDTGDGDGDTGDGDGDTGDGDGDTGDGDGDTGDGDGDTGDGDGDGEELIELELLAEDFNGLPSANGTSDVATFQAALPNWALYNSNDNRHISHGNSNTGAIYSFGVNGDSDRALGGVASGGTDTQGFGVCITNETAADYEDVMVTYVGEQWRNGGNETAQALSFAYTTNADVATNLQVGTTVIDASGADPSMGWFDFPSLDFTGPIHSADALALDGHAAENQAAISEIISGLVVPAGGVLCIRWLDPDDGGTDHGLGIDDLVVTAMTTP